MISRTMSAIVRFLAGACALLACASALLARPNIVVFVADDLGWRDLSCAGSTFYESPHIDSLAARGTIFTSAYSACPVCSPTRAALMTGKYPQRVGITDYIGGPQPIAASTQPKYADRLLPAPYSTHLALEETTIAEVLGQAGYATYFTGKWHLGAKPFFPDKQGFDTINGAGGGSPGRDGYFSPYRIDLSPGPPGEHIDLRLANDAAKWLATQSHRKPFFLWFCLYDPHVPLMAPAKTIEYFEAKRKRLALGDEFGDEGQSRVRLNQSHTTYAAMIKTLDDAVGIVLAQLQSQGLMDDTIIIFTSDNGGLSTAEGAPTSNAPVRAGKGWPYEGGIRVPLIVVVPGLTRPGSRCDQRAISMDIPATIQAACESPASASDGDGINLLPALKGDHLPDRNLFWHYPHYGNQGGQPFSAIRSGDYKLIIFHDARHVPELYNLATDPGEKINLADREPAKVAQLGALLSAWKKEVGAIDASPRSAPPASQ
jgi:arylsulfatase A-like enzyme